MAKKNPNPFPSWGSVGGLLAQSALQKFTLDVCHLEELIVPFTFQLLKFYLDELGECSDR